MIFKSDVSFVQFQCGIISYNQFELLKCLEYCLLPVCFTNVSAPLQVCIPCRGMLVLLYDYLLRKMLNLTCQICLDVFVNESIILTGEYTSAVHVWTWPWVLKNRSKKIKKWNEIFDVEYIGKIHHTIL